MRYSTDNVNMPAFQITQLISMVMGMPILFLFVTLGSLYKVFQGNTHKRIHSCGLRFRLLFWTGLTYLYHFWRSYLRRLFGISVLHVYVSVPFLPEDDLDDRTYDWNFTLGFKDNDCD